MHDIYTSGENVLNKLKDYLKNKKFNALLWTLLLALFCRLCWPILLNLISSYTDRAFTGPSEPEKEVHRLILAASGKTANGKDCKFLCDTASSEYTFGMLMSQATPPDRNNLKIYSTCFDKKRQSDQKLNRIHSVEIEFKKIGSYFDLQKLQNDIPEFDEFDKEFFAKDSKVLENFFNSLKAKIAQTEGDINSTQITLAGLCQQTNNNFCVKILDIYAKFSEKFRLTYSDQDLLSLFNSRTRDCIERCKIQNKLVQSDTKKETGINQNFATTDNIDGRHIIEHKNARTLTVSFDNKIKITDNAYGIINSIRTELKKSGYNLNEADNPNGYNFYIQNGDVDQKPRNSDGIYITYFTIRSKGAENLIGQGKGVANNSTEATEKAQENAARDIVTQIK